jgi:nucleoside-diphosphate-sugar epimerase
MSVSARRVLLTGGAGFIGSHVAESLLGQGAELTIVDNLDEFYPPAWKRSNLEDIRRTGKYNLEELDICNFERLREVFRRARPEVVIHLAARAGVRPSIEQPRLYEQVNVAGTVNLLELCREFKVERFVFGSSSSVYGATSRAPFPKTMWSLGPFRRTLQRSWRAKCCAIRTRIYLRCRLCALGSSLYTDLGSGLIWPSTNSRCCSRATSRCRFLATDQPVAITRMWTILWRAF